MITDITGIELTPGNKGVDCKGNGTYFYENGGRIECCCDECDYMKCCFEMEECDSCSDIFCPNVLRRAITLK